MQSKIDFVRKKTVYDELAKKVHTIQTIDTSDLVKKTAYNMKIKDIEDKSSDRSVYITTNHFTNFQIQYLMKG